MRTPFETEPCSRYGGSGHHPRCQMYGTTCFKCAGAGLYLTKHGQQDHDRWRAAVDSVTVRPVGDLVAGMACKIDANDMRRYHPVASISTPHPGSCGHMVDGVTVWPPVVTVTFAEPVLCSSPVFGRYDQTEFDVPVDGTVRIHPGDDAMPKPEAFVTPRKRRCPDCRRMFTATQECEPCQA